MRVKTVKGWILANKEWLFSGVGVVLISSAIALFWPKNPNREDQSSQHQNSSGSSVNVQVQDVPGQVNITVPSPDNRDSENNKFQVTDILSAANPNGTWTLDFRLLNNSDRTVTVSRLKLVVVKYDYIPPKPRFSQVTAVYEIGLDELRKPGDYVESSVAQVIKPGEDDRFEVILGIKEFHELELHIWELEPILITSEGEITATKQVVLIP